jgi:hypothetical protein
MGLRQKFHEIRMRLLERTYNRLSPADAFDRIYTKGEWGRDVDGLPYSGTGSRDERLVGAYVEKVQAFLDTLPDSSIVDLGCGDYSVGSRIKCTSYIGCDISEVVLRSNRERFPHVDFRHLNIVEDQLPTATVGIVRQVLQHLDNASIAKFIAKPLPFNYLIVTEGMASCGLIPNLDKPTGPHVRIGLASGVDLSLPPFGLPYPQLLAFDVQGNRGRHPHVIRTTIYDLRR